MYAVIKTGGKQYRVEVGTELQVEHLDVAPGDAITLDRVLLVADGADASIGRPLLTDAVVSAEVLRQDRGEKLISFKYRPKARSRVKKGHRQELTVLRVTDVRLGGRSAAEDARRAEEAQQSERERLQETAARQAAADRELAAKLAPKPEPAPEKPARARGRASGATTDTTETPPTTKGRTRRADATADAPTTKGARAKSTDVSAGAKPAPATDKAKTTEKRPRAPRTKKES
jgi:large subunit ribosomal protein L21